MNLYTVSYTSSAIRFPTAQDFKYLLLRARARNEKEAVTGVLLYADGTFHQYIEGPAAGVDRVYAAILRDPLHHDIFELIREPIKRREFAQWSMAYPSVRPDAGDASMAQLHEMLCDESARLTPGRLLLNAFWTKGLARGFS